MRARVGTPFPWARSAIVCLASYHSAQPRSTDPAPADAGWIARYAWSSRVDAEGRAAAERLSQGAAEAAEDAGGAAARGTRRIRVARLCGYRAGGGARAGHRRGPGMDSEEHLPDPSKAGIVRVSRRAAHLAGNGAGSRELDGSRSLRNLPALPRCVPHECAVRAVPDGRDEVHFLSDHRTSRADCAGADERHGAAGVRLRHLPGRVPVEFAAARR